MGTTLTNVSPSPHRQGHKKGLKSGGYIKAGVFEEQKRERKRVIADNTRCGCEKLSQCVQGARLWSFALAAVLWPAFT